MSLNLAIDVRLDAFTLLVDIDVPTGETLAVVGPNGAGKSTLLACLAGLVAIDSGKIVLDDTVLDDDNTRLTPEERDIGVVFQDHRLFEHLSVIENVAFGLRARGARRKDARAQGAALLDEMGLSNLAERRASDLSGGQRQRVAMLRALAIRPRLLLLDEPLSAIDLDSREEWRQSLAHHIESFAGTTLIVSHDPIDVERLADRVVTLDNGRVIDDQRTTNGRS
jgi:molybdate transport system ATP-binding protein